MNNEFLKLFDTEIESCKFDSKKYFKEFIVYKNNENVMP